MINPSFLSDKFCFILVNGNYIISSIECQGGDNIMCILEKFKQKIEFNKSYKEYLESGKKSADAIKNVSFSDGMAPLYFSERRINNFLDAFSINPVISTTVEGSQSKEKSITIKAQGNIMGVIGMGIEATGSDNNKKTTKNHREDSYIKTIKDSIEYIKSKGCSILDATEMNFFYANFPVFHGSLIELTTEVTDVYLWYGEYRNIKLYLCGNKKNVSSVDRNEFPSTEWDPSSITGQKSIFQHLINEEKDKNFKNEEIFGLFEDNIHKSVMNRHEAKSSYQWQEMIVYCTNIKEENGIKKIIGIPLLVIPSKSFGYGWYNLKYKLLDVGKIKIGNNINNKDTFFESDDDKFIINNDINNKDAFFEFDNGEFTGRFLMKEKELYYSTSPDKVKFSDRVKVIDTNSAYQHRYSIKKIPTVPLPEQVKESDDIIGLCIDKNLLK